MFQVRWYSIPSYKEYSILLCTANYSDVIKFFTFERPDLVFNRCVGVWSNGIERRFPGWFEFGFKDFSNELILKY